MNELPRDARIVSDEVVTCPLARRDRDVETCLRCPWLRSVGEAGGTRFVRCAPPFAQLPLGELGASPA